MEKMWTGNSPASGNIGSNGPLGFPPSGGGFKPAMDVDEPMDIADKKRDLISPTPQPTSSTINAPSSSLPEPQPPHSSSTSTLNSFQEPPISHPSSISHTPAPTIPTSNLNYNIPSSSQQTNPGTVSPITTSTASSPIIQNHIVPTTTTSSSTVVDHHSSSLTSSQPQVQVPNEPPQPQPPQPSQTPQLQPQQSQHLQEPQPLASNIQMQNQPQLVPNRPLIPPSMSLPLRSPMSPPPTLPINPSLPNSHKMVSTINKYLQYNVYSNVFIRV